MHKMSFRNPHALGSFPRILRTNNHGQCASPAPRSLRCSHGVMCELTKYCWLSSMRYLDPRAGTKAKRQLKFGPNTWTQPDRIMHVGAWQRGSRKVSASSIWRRPRVNVDAAIKSDPLVVAAAQETWKNQIVSGTGRRCGEIETDWVLR